MNQPIPPEGYRLLTDEEKTRPLPMDAIYWSKASNEWKPSTYRDKVPARYDDGSMDEIATRLSNPIPPRGYRLLTWDEKQLPLAEDVLSFHEIVNEWRPSRYAGTKLPGAWTKTQFHYATRQPAQPEPDQSETPDCETCKKSGELILMGRRVLCPHCSGTGKRDPRIVALESELTSERSRREAAERERDELSAKCGGMSAEQRFNQLMDVRNELLKAGHKFGLACTHHYASAVVTELIEARTELAALKAKLEQLRKLGEKADTQLEETQAALDLRDADFTKVSEQRDAAQTSLDAALSREAQLRGVLTQIRDRFFPANQHEADQDLMWEPVNAAIAQPTDSTIADLRGEVERWRQWPEYACRRFTEETGQDLQAAQ